MNTPSVKPHIHSVTFSVPEMHCRACEVLVEKESLALPEISHASANSNSRELVVHFESSVTAESIRTRLNKAVAQYGYSVRQSVGQSVESPLDISHYVIPFGLAFVCIIGFLIFQSSRFFSVANGNSFTYTFVFLMGIIASFSSCMVVVGSIVLSFSAHQSRLKKYRDITAFHLSRILGFFVLGGIIGAAGATISITPLVNIVLHIVLFLIILILAVDLLELRRFVALPAFTLPKGVWSHSQKYVQAGNSFAPILLGASTFFLPCGFTQSMQFTALASQSFVQGALIMGIFALGTFPMLFIASFASVRFAQSKYAPYFFHFAGFLVILFGFVNMYHAYQLISAF